MAVEVCRRLPAKTAKMDVKQLLDTLSLPAAAGARSPSERDHSASKAAPIYLQINNGRGGYDTLPVPSDPDA